MMTLADVLTLAGFVGLAVAISMVFCFVRYSPRKLELDGSQVQIRSEVGKLKRSNRELWQHILSQEAVALQKEVMFGAEFQRKEKALRELYWRGNRGVVALREISTSSLVEEELRNVAKEFLDQINDENSDTEDHDDQKRGKTPHIGKIVIKEGGEFRMGDDKFYNERNQVGQQGSGLKAGDLSFYQTNLSSDNVDAAQLAEELGKLREALKNDSSTPEHDLEIGSIAAAEVEAGKGNVTAALEHLKKITGWALGVAEKIGIPVAIAAIKQQAGL